MSAATLELQRFTLDEARRILADPMLDRRYLETRLGPDARDFLVWFRLSGASARTQDTYERILARLCVNLPAGVGIADVTVDDLMLMLDTIPPGSWKLHRAVYNRLFRWAIIHGRRDVINPVDLLPSLLGQGRTPVHKIFTAGEQGALVNAARYMDDPVRDRARALMLLSTGMRKGEARGLRIGDVDTVGRCIVVTGKGNRQRLIPVRGEFWLAWENQLFEPIPRLGRLPVPDDHVWFPMRVAGAYLGRERQVTEASPERPMSERGFHEWWRRLCGHAGIQYRNLHMTRHTYATDALDASGGDLYGVATVLGHASTKTTEGYVHSSKRRMESVADKLNRARREQNG